MISNMFYIKRNDIEFGPFSSEKIITQCKSRVIFMSDLIRHENTKKYITISEFIKLNDIDISQKEEKIKDILFNILKLQSIFTNPFKYMNSSIKENAIIYVLLTIVLIPILGLLTLKVPSLSYSIYGFYFALIWGLILYKTIATKQTDLKIIIITSIVTILLSTIIISLFHNTSLWILIKGFIDSKNYVLKLIGMFLGVALIEESLKQIFVYLTILREDKIILPRTAILYGMIAGLSFGIFEGVEYQMTINKTFTQDSNYFLNIIRLTSIPFFHAIWAGIGAYFASLSFLELQYKYSFRIMGLLLPAILHTLYNVLGISILGISVTIFSTILLTVYLTKSDIVGKQLNKI